MKVKDVLELNIFKGSVVFAGHSGLNRVVEFVDVFEVPDIAENWLMPKTFLLSTTFAIKELDEEYILKIFTAMISNNVAAIAIKLGRFIEALPNSVIDLANDENFPIILLPMDFAYPCAIKEVLGKIVLMEENKRHYQKKQDILEYILNNDVDLTTSTEINALEVDERHKVQVCVFYSRDYKENFYEYVTDKLKEIVCDCIAYAATDSLVILMFYRKSRIEIRNFTCNYDTMNKIFDDRNLIVGIGREHFFDKVKKSYIDSLMVLRIILSMGYEYGVFPFKSVEIFAMMLSNGNKNELIQASKKLIDPLINYDLQNNTSHYATLKTLCSVGFSKQEAMDKMHIHRNTLTYRVNAIKKIIGFESFSESDIFFKLRLALIVYNFYDITSDMFRQNKQQK